MLSILEPIGKITKLLWYTSICPYAYGIECLPTNLANVYKCNFKKFTKAHIKCCEAIMDDLLLFTPSKKAHIAKMEDLLKALRKNGLKISPKKCQLFRMELQYMGNIIFIKDRRVCVKPLHSCLEAIQKIKPPTTAKQCKSFAGMVNFVSIFCPDLQKLLKPIYDLRRKGRQFVWRVEQQNAFDEIKQRLQEPPVLHMSDKIGRFQLYSEPGK